MNEILSKNNYQSSKKSDSENDSNAPIKCKLIKIYKLSWKSDKIMELLYTIDNYVEKHFPENRRDRISKVENDRPVLSDHDGKSDQTK
ncbi:hypothetical protein C1645_824171 [Glomus cerebriforme]|uniref:Uncharacterized protein n=1 Tax=Glomus cerebriforme TaxID=658196 RepID=A0A397SYX8_9GLOM|nr:hypothetical protein C1645_824171 [Glomus cerebriforme]